MGSKRILSDLRHISEQVQREFEQERRVLSFQEYLELFASDPPRHSRDASRYLRDMFDHYGHVTVERPWGAETRFSLFDLPFAEMGARGTRWSARRPCRARSTAP